MDNYYFAPSSYLVVVGIKVIFGTLVIIQGYRDTTKCCQFLFNVFMINGAGKFKLYLMFDNNGVRKFVSFSLV